MLVFKHFLLVVDLWRADSEIVAHELNSELVTFLFNCNPETYASGEKAMDTEKSGLSPQKQEAVSSYLTRVSWIRSRVREYRADNL